MPPVWVLPEVATPVNPTAADTSTIWTCESPGATPMCRTRQSLNPGTPEMSGGYTSTCHATVPGSVNRSAARVNDAHSPAVSSDALHSDGSDTAVSTRNGSLMPAHTPPSKVHGPGPCPTRLP